MKKYKVFVIKISRELIFEIINESINNKFSESLFFGIGEESLNKTSFLVNSINGFLMLSLHVQNNKKNINFFDDEFYLSEFFRNESTYENYILMKLNQDVLIKFLEEHINNKSKLKVRQIKFLGDINSLRCVAVLSTKNQIPELDIEKIDKNINFTKCNYNKCFPCLLSNIDIPQYEKIDTI